MTDANTPPIDPELEDQLAERPSWPKVVGIISIVWGSLGLVCNGCGLASPLLMGMVPMPPGETERPPSMQPSGLMLALAAFSLLWAVFLIIAGVATIQRSAAGRLMHLVYALGSVVLLGFAILVQFQQAAAMDQWVKDHASSAFAKAHNPSFMYVGLAISVVFGLAYPGFCLVWFGLIKKTQESMLRVPVAED